MKLTQLNVLMAEDDENDRFLLTRAIAATGVRHKIHLVCHGGEAIDYLRGAGDYADRGKYPFPNMIVLDIKMPVRTGLDVLRWLHDHEECSVIPTIIFTSSAEHRDVKESFRLAASGYFTKPAGLDELTRVMKLILDYWFESHVPELPERESCA